MSPGAVPMCPRCLGLGTSSAHRKTAHSINQIPGWLLDAEFVAFRVGHNDVVGAWFLDLLENTGTEVLEPGDLAVAVLGTGM